MRIRYVGGRSFYEVTFERKAYQFTPANNRILEINDKRIINYIFSLPNREFEVVGDESPVIPQVGKEEVAEDIKLKFKNKSKAKAGGK